MSENIMLADEPLVKKISELERVLDIYGVQGVDLVELSVFQDGGEYASRGASIEQLGYAILNSVNWHTELETTSTTIFGAINELNRGGGGGDSNVTMGDNDDGGVDLSVDGTVRTLAKEEDLATINTYLQSDDFKQMILGIVEEGLPQAESEEV